MIVMWATPCNLLVPSGLVHPIMYVLFPFDNGLLLCTSYFMSWRVRFMMGSSGHMVTWWTAVKYSVPARSGHVHLCHCLFLCWPRTLIVHEFHFDFLYDLRKNSPASCNYKQNPSLALSSAGALQRGFLLSLRPLTPLMPPNPNHDVRCMGELQ